MFILRVFHLFMSTVFLVIMVVALYSFSNTISSVATSGSRIEDATIYEGVVEERYRDSRNTGGMAYSTGGMGMYMMTGGSTTTDYWVIVGGAEHKIDKGTWVHLSEGTTIQYQKTVSGNLDNVVIIRDKTTDVEGSVVKEEKVVEESPEKNNEEAVQTHE